MPEVGGVVTEQPITRTWLVAAVYGPLRATTILLAGYFLLPIGAAYFTDLFKTKVWGVINFGLVFAWSEFIVAWGLAWIYARRANAEFDALAAEINRDAMKNGGNR